MSSSNRLRVVGKICRSAQDVATGSRVALLCAGDVVSSWTGS